MAGMGSLMSSKIEQIIAEFFVKCLHVILDSRIPCLQQSRESPLSSSASTSSLGMKSKDKWFNLIIPDSPFAQESAEAWKRRSAESMVIDILLVKSPGWHGDHQRSRRTSPGRVGTPDSWSEGDGEDSTYGTVLERWIIRHERASSSSGSSSHGSERALEVPGVYKRAVLMIRTLYSTIRTLPAHRLFHLANTSSQSRSFSLTYKVSVSPPPLPEADEATMEVRGFTPVETPGGRLWVSVAYRHTTAITALEVTPPILPRIIADYVGSPTTDPLRRVPTESLTGSMPSGGISGRRGVHVVSLPTSPSGIGRRHSWGGGLNKLPPALLPPSSPSFKTSRSPSPSQASASPPRIISFPQSCPQPIPFPEHHHHKHHHRLSPPSLLPHSPPGTCHSLESSLTRYLPRHTSSPVNIPKPTGPRAHLDRGSLPPPSPSPRRSFEQQQGTSNLSSGRGYAPPRLSASTLAESLLVISPPHPYHPTQEDKPEEGPPSGVKRSLYGSPRVSLSRSSSKIHDDADDEEFACPFAVDEDEAEELRSRSPRNRQQGNIFEASGPKSQHAAVGALVRMLKSAHPLHGGLADGGFDLGGCESSSSAAGGFKGRASSGRPIPGAEKVERDEAQAQRRLKTSGEALKELEVYKGILLETARWKRKCTEKQLSSHQS